MLKISISQDGSLSEPLITQAQLQLQPQLHRALSQFSNFGISFSCISVITGICTLYDYGLQTGGPVVLVWGWLVVSFFSTLVALSMAEICSEYPRAGGVYFWVAQLLADNDNGDQPSESELRSGLRSQLGLLLNPSFWVWEAAWFNILGQVTVFAGVDYGLAKVVAALMYVATDGRITATQEYLFCIYSAVLFLHAVINSLPVSYVGELAGISVWWHMIGVVVIVVTLLSTAPSFQTSSFVFTQFHNETGIRSPAWVVGIGLLVAQYTLTGYDSSAAVSDETKQPASAAPMGIIMAVVVSILPGWFLVLGLTFCIQDYNDTVDTNTGFAVAQISLDCAGKTGAISLLVIIVGAAFMCGSSALTSCSRMIWAFARDGGLPFSAYILYVLPMSKVPVVAVWTSALLAFVFAAPSVYSSEAFAAVTSIGTSGLYISYSIPIFLALVLDKTFNGSFTLGGWGRPIRVVSILWVGFITIMFVLPQAQPVTISNFNYASILVGTVLTFSVTSWIFSAQGWFHGPAIQAEEKMGSTSA